MNINKVKNLISVDSLNSSELTEYKENWDKSKDKNIPLYSVFQEHFFEETNFIYLGLNNFNKHIFLKTNLNSNSDFVYEEKNIITAEKFEKIADNYFYLLALQYQAKYLLKKLMNTPELTEKVLEKFKKLFIVNRVSKINIGSVSNNSWVQSYTSTFSNDVYLDVNNKRVCLNDELKNLREEIDNLKKSVNKLSKKIK